MLTELKVTNFAIISQVHLQFQTGLNILSGETGAGKSVLLNSLALLMGDKSSSETIRNDAETATIEGAFDLSPREDIQARLQEMGIDCSDDTLIVRRVISKQGKSKVYLNGSLSALSNLREIVAPLIEVTGHSVPLLEMTGQHENKNLQSRSYHLDLLDFYTGSWPLRKEIKSLFEAKMEKQNKLTSLQTSLQSQEQRLDFLKFQREEIKSLQLPEGGEQELEASIRRANSAQDITHFVENCLDQLYSADDAVLVKLHKVLQLGGALSKIDPSFQQKLDNLAQAKTIVEDFVYEMRDYDQNTETHPEALSELQEALSQLRKLQKKYGKSVDEIYEQLQLIEEEIANLDNSDEAIQTLENEIKKIDQKLLEASLKLHKRRSNGSELLSQSVNTELEELNMKGVIFSVLVDKLDTPVSTGISQVQFMIQQTKKDKPRPISKVASGGELSRILLALKRVIGHSELPRTYLFDEVDTGVSGETAHKVGRKLKAISQGQQVICITHLPQVASYADTHFFLEKRSSRDKMAMQVKLLQSEEKVKEVARLLSGEKITKASLKNAAELIKSCSSSN